MMQDDSAEDMPDGLHQTIHFDKSERNGECRKRNGPHALVSITG